MIDDYLVSDQNLRCVLVLVDCRHEPTAPDRQMIAYLHHNIVPYFVVATKADKLSKAKLERSLAVIANTFAMGRADITPVSSFAKKGADAVLARIESILSATEQSDGRESSPQ